MKHLYYVSLLCMVIQMYNYAAEGIEEKIKTAMLQQMKIEFIVPHRDKTIRSAPIAQQLSYYATKYFPPVINARNLSFEKLKFDSAENFINSLQPAVFPAIRIGSVIRSALVLYSLLQLSKINNTCYRICNATFLTAACWNLVLPIVESYVTNKSFEAVQTTNVMGLCMAWMTAIKTLPGWNEKPKDYQQRIDKAILPHCSTLQFIRPWGTKYCLEDDIKSVHWVRTCLDKVAVRFGINLFKEALTI